MGGWDKDRVARVSSLANEEPLVVVEAGVDIVREVIGKNRGDSRDSVIRKGKTSLRCGGYGSVCKGASGAEDRDISRNGGIGGHRGSVVFATRRSDKDVVGVNCNVFMKRGEEESVEDFLGYARGCGRHGR